jgi:GT2 family glycosyltransferase
MLDCNHGSRPVISGMASIVILTRNALDYTKLCIDSIRKHTPEHMELIFIDNGSTDGTVPYLQTIANSKLIRNDYNKGFSVGCNQGMAEAAGEYIILLNNDTVVTAGWLTRLLGWLKQDPSIGIVGPCTNFAYSAQMVHPVPYQSMEEMELFAKVLMNHYEGKGIVAERLIGFCMAFHRNLIETIGGLDEQFFPGCYEDDDFCLRTRISGKRLWVAKDVYVHHHGNISFHVNGEDIHGSVMWDNRSRFWHKWAIPDPYLPSEIVEREKPFRPERHYVPLHARI